MAFDDTGNPVISAEEIEIVFNAIGPAIALEQQKRPGDNVQAVGAHLIVAQTPFRGRSKVHHALLALIEAGRVKQSRKGVNPRVAEFAPVEVG